MLIIVGASTLNIDFLTNLEEKLYKHDKGTSEFVFIENIPYIGYKYGENKNVDLQLNSLMLTRFVKVKPNNDLNNISDLVSLNSSILIILCQLYI